MRFNCYTFNNSPVLFRGYVYYEDMTPVKNAVVLIEKVLPKSERYFQNINSESNYAYTKTNKYGQFCFKIFDNTYYYRVKIFDNNI